MFTAAIARHLHARGLVTFGVTGTNAFLDDLPDTPADAIGLYSRPGGADTDGGHGYDEPSVQILVRNTTSGRARGGYEKAVAIRDALHGLSHVTIAEGTPDEVYVVQLLAETSAPVNIGDDSDNRPRWSITVRGEVHAPTALRP